MPSEEKGSLFSRMSTIILGKVIARPKDPPNFTQSRILDERKFVSGSQRAATVVVSMFVGGLLIIFCQRFTWTNLIGTYNVLFMLYIVINF